MEGTPAEHFENYDELLGCIIESKNEKHPDDAPIDWSFTIYLPEQVGALYVHSKCPSEAMKEAFEENLPLIEICTGDYKNSL